LIPLRSINRLCGGLGLRGLTDKDLHYPRSHKPANFEELNLLTPSANSRSFSEV
jgi:hypothetical protein